MFLTAKDSSEERKKKILKAMVRWHPDKFNQVFGDKVRPAEKERILARVNTTSQSIIELRQIFN